MHKHLLGVRLKCVHTVCIVGFPDAEGGMFTPSLVLLFFTPTSSFFYPQKTLHVLGYRSPSDFYVLEELNVCCRSAESCCASAQDPAIKPHLLRFVLEVWCVRVYVHHRVCICVCVFFFSIVSCNLGLGGAVLNKRILCMHYLV